MKRLRRVMKGRWSLTIAAGFILGLFLAAFFAPLPIDPRAIDVDAVLQAPSATHWFGTDTNGFDVFSRTIVAARLDLTLAFLGTVTGMMTGVVLGLLAGEKGRSGELIMRALDAFEAFPLLILSIAFVALAGRNLGVIVVAIAIVTGPRFARLVRSESLALREARFVDAALAMGASRTRILRRHILPNVSGVILAQASVGSAQAVRVIAALSFLGVGITPPAASWGTMVQQGSRSVVAGAWWVSFFPAVAITLTIVALNVIADRLNDVFDRTEQ